MGGQIGEMKVRMEEDGFIDEKEKMPKEGGKKVKDKKGEEKTELEWYEFPLPKPPIPELSHTLSRYLEYSSVLAQTYSLDLERTKRCVKKFEENIGQKLQQKLVELAEKEQNWINHFWLPEMYLRQRIPLPLNFNPAYIFPRKHFLNEKDQIDYAAWLVRGFLDFKMRVDRKQIPRESVPDRFSGLGNVKMCMDQYERILNNYRQPGEEEDILMDRRICVNFFENGTMNGNLRKEEHILVLSHSQAFVLFTQLDDRPIPAPKIAENLIKIRLMSKNRSPIAVVPLGAASTGQRGRAAQFWAEMVKECVNQCSLDWVRTSVFVLCLDENENEENDDEKLMSNQEKDGLQMLHGFGAKRNGLNRWFDATIQLIVSANGCCGMCIEHSVAEGIVYIKMTEEVISFANENWAKRHHQKEEEENNLALIAPEPMPLKWTITKNALNMLEAQITEFDQMANDLQLRVLEFTGFGKNAIKGWRISPDGFVQLSMQLAHFKLHGYLVSSYESATMRRYRFGRVDNIRAATPEALEWVKAMEDKREQKREEQRALFLNAANKQALTTRENVTGQGIDNHLCALEVLSRQYDGKDEETELFREPMWSEMMRFPLSTSQVTTSNSVEFHDCYLCYGPVVRDGYGCAYNIQPDRMIFAISTWKLDPRTNCDDFREKIRESLKEMQQLLEN